MNDCKPVLQWCSGKKAFLMTSVMLDLKGPIPSNMT